jgi:HPt (histidine-containing phosphotransfer) domain-containing protein
MSDAESSGSGRSGPLDPTYLKDVCSLSVSLLEEVARRFAGDASERMAAIRTATVRGDPEGVAREAHSLKGSAAVVGALGLVFRCEVMEERARQGVAPSREALVDAERELEEVLSEVARVAAAHHPTR